MSVRFGLLALLADGPRFGVQLRSEFERRTGGTWPLNIGQVYTTLGRLQRDGLVAQVDTTEERREKEYVITAAGRDEVDSWWTSAALADPDPRDELTIKLALAVETSGIEVRDVVQRHRAEGVQRLQELTKIKRAGARDVAAELILERRIFDAEAQIRWLDHVEDRYLRSPSRFGTGTADTARQR